MLFDSVILEFDKAIRTLFGPVPRLSCVPGRDLSEPILSLEEKRLSGALMRINHVGEICAQALYQGQALVCHDRVVRASLEGAAQEEEEHLAWTAQRLKELGARKSCLNPIWYLGSFAIGVAAGMCGTGLSLGFLAETERQVGAHLDGHLYRLPSSDERSRAIVLQMKIDEMAHSEMAIALGGGTLPPCITMLMRVVAKVMTRTAYMV